MDIPSSISLSLPTLKNKAKTQLQGRDPTILRPTNAGQSRLSQEIYVTEIKMQRGIYQVTRSKRILNTLLCLTLLVEVLDSFMYHTRGIVVTFLTNTIVKALHLLRKYKHIHIYSFLIIIFSTLIIIVILV